MTQICEYAMAKVVLMMMDTPQACHNSVPNRNYCFKVTFTVKMCCTVAKDLHSFTRCVLGDPSPDTERQDHLLED